MTPPFSDHDVVPWTPHAVPTVGAYCTICRWTGPGYGSGPHPEGNHCPGCGSIARERFLHRAWVENWAPMEWAEVIETSPRLGTRYRDLMVRRLRYRGSDYDRRAHQADVRIDLQAIDLPDNSLDVLLTSHVLEHVPDTCTALSEIHRVLAPGGVAVIQVPLVEPRTIPPSTPEFHGDDTPVFWRFGWDLGDLLASVGFEVDVNVTESWAHTLETGTWSGPTTPEVDLGPIIEAGRDVSVKTIVPREHESTMGFEAGYGLVTWTAKVPGIATPRCAPSLAELQTLRRRRRRRDLITRLNGHPLDVSVDIADSVEPSMTWGAAFVPVYEKFKQSLGPVRPVLRKVRRVVRAPFSGR
ncbi:class I SAM-dependent methyltransferase [Actinospongicola halichondriae]|uniref:class I SAM-dependent methyltransferase n=1 Tax=Actinospongicola halichondriae TaxID=3236844 RepID=UPI003D496673